LTWKTDCCRKGSHPPKKVGKKNAHPRKKDPKGGVANHGPRGKNVDLEEAKGRPVCIDDQGGEKRRGGGFGPT